MVGIHLPRRSVPAEVTAATDIVAIGGQLTAQGLLDAYSQAEFPMEIEVDHGRRVTAWYSPAARAVLQRPGMHVSRSLRRSMRGFAITYDRAFDEVLAGCADPDREHGWINAGYQRVYTELFGAGHAHSVEVWQAGELVGGLIGVERGGLFCADSKFRRVTDASKAAVAGLSALVFSGGWGPDRMIDAQWLTDHLESLGFRPMPRAEYRAELPRLLRVPGAFAELSAGQ
jgi:leucyl/phenylalanyl-tRNA--protein transferase